MATWAQPDFMLSLPTAPRCLCSSPEGGPIELSLLGHLVLLSSPGAEQGSDPLSLPPRGALYWLSSRAGETWSGLTPECVVRGNSHHMAVDGGGVLWVPSPWNSKLWERGSYSLHCTTSVPGPLHSFSTICADILGTQLHEGQQRVAGHSPVPVFSQADLFSAAKLQSFLGP